MMALVCVGLNSCSSGFSPESAKEMLQKYEDGKMTEADFSTCIDWSEEYFAEAFKEMEGAMDKAENAEDFGKIMKDVEEKLDKKYANMQDIVSMLTEAAAKNDKAMGQKNIDRWNKVEKDFEKKIKDFMGKAMEKSVGE